MNIKISKILKLFYLNINHSINDLIVLLCTNA